MVKLLVLVHVMFGVLAMVAMLGALLTSKGGVWHRRSGRMYSGAMAVALILATVVSVVTLNLFLLLIGFFSAYFVYTGWRLAVVKDGVKSALDKHLSRAMVAAGVMMMAYGVYLFITAESVGVALVVFGVIAFLPAWSDLRASDWPKGKERIVEHLGRMGGASIATVTAAFVVNVQTNPAFIAWLLPSLLGGALIVYWTRRVRGPGTV